MYIFFLAFIALASGEEFRTLFAWKEMEFEFPNNSLGKSLIESGYYIPANNMPVGLNLWGDKMFITVPRWKNGVASTLNYYQMNHTDMSPALIPYPDWESNDIRNPGALVSIFRVRIDACDRMWGLDTGVDGDTVVQPTSLVAIDLKTDKVIQRYRLKDTDLKQNSFIADLVLDGAEGCDDLYIYLSDFGGSGVVVYSLAKNDSWRIEHNFFYFDPLHGDYNYSGLDFQWTDGVFGMSLSPVRDDKSRTFYFHPMSSIHEFAVDTKVLKDQSLNLSSNYYAFHVMGVKGERTQGPSSVIDQETGINYFVQPITNSVACWDTDDELNPHTFVTLEQNNETLCYANDLVISPDNEHLLVLSNNLPFFDHSLLKSNNYNYFVTVALLDRLTDMCVDM